MVTDWSKVLAGMLVSTHHPLPPSMICDWRNSVRVVGAERQTACLLSPWHDDLVDLKEMVRVCLLRLPQGHDLTSLVRLSRGRYCT